MIRAQAKLLALLPLATVLSGCIYGQCIEGPCALERERIIKSIKPYLLYWEKAGITEEERRADSTACGAGPKGMAVSVQFTDAQEEAEKHQEEKDYFPARERLSRAWVECMKAKGYRYVR